MWTKREGGQGRRSSASGLHLLSCVPAFLSVLAFPSCSSLPLSGSEIPVAQALDPADLRAEDREPALVRRGDVLRLVVAEHAEFGGTLTVGPTGAVRVPTLQRDVELAGATVEAARDRLAAAVAPSLRTVPDVTVEVDRGDYYTVTGDVPHPGRFPLLVGERPALLDALAPAYRPAAAEQYRRALARARTPDDAAAAAASRPDPFALDGGRPPGGTVVCFRRTPVGNLYVRVPFADLLRGEPVEGLRVGPGFLLHVESAPPEPQFVGDRR